MTEWQERREFSSRHFSASAVCVAASPTSWAPRTKSQIVDIVLPPRPPTRIIRYRTLGDQKKRTTTNHVFAFHCISAFCIEFEQVQVDETYVLPSESFRTCVEKAR